MGLFENYKELLPLKNDIEKAIDILVETYKHNSKILVCGNGGSSADSAHITGELMKSFMLKRSIDPITKKELEKYEDGKHLSNMLEMGVPCIDLTAESALLSAYANDKDASLCYAQLVYGYSYNSRFDCLIGLSTSGNSKNVVNAFKVAKALGLKTIALTGSKDSMLSELADVTIKAPSDITYRVQEYHLPIYHYICQEVEKRLFIE